ncbi:hypothetical protein [Leclercia adecarboxylata]|uniref:hypothetical protein n=1 Tax=Leclercia adecarboxylata TaxID=83655 RepID=UPI0013CC92EE|nr:hypothetical protein [Leclercia adecarboxylata]NEG94094.1 hypothetical protein [Leclercia adecarboxylata]
MANFGDIHRAPINKTAALVTGKGFSYEPDCIICTPEFVGPPEIADVRDLLRNPSFIDLTGRKKGRFTVIGLMKEGRGKWVVRCVCGTYTIRNAKAIKGADSNPNAHIDACRRCMHEAYRKRERIYRTTGKDVDLSEVF